MVTDSKLKIVKPGDNVSALPVIEEPQAVHFARAAALRPVNELTEAELYYWDLLAPELAMLGRLKNHFVMALCELCRVTRRLKDARATLDEKDWTYVVHGRNGTQHKSRPEVAQLNDDWRKWNSLINQFGMSPNAERGLTLGQADLFDDFDNF